MSRDSESAAMHNLAAAYALDAVDDAERVAFERHLAGCSTCRADVAEFRETAAVMAATDEVQVPDSLRATVTAGVARTAQVPPGRSPRAIRRSHRLTIMTVAASVLAIALVAVGAFSFLQGRAYDEMAASTEMVAGVLTAPDAHMVSVPLTDDGSSTVVMSKNMDKAVLVASGVGAPPPGMAYQTWMETPGGAMHPAGTWLPDSQGSAAVQIAGDVGAMRGVMITVEPASGSAQPTSVPIGHVSMA